MIFRIESLANCTAEIHLSDRESEMVYAGIYQWVIIKDERF